MNQILLAGIEIVAGLVVGLGIADAVLAGQVYKQFPHQKRKWWPGSGIWMAWKVIEMLRLARSRLNMVHMAASQFPMTPGHNNATREFVAVVKKATQVGSNGGEG